MIRQGVCMAALAVAAALMTGCGQEQTVAAGSDAPRQVRPAEELVAMSRPPIPDIPLPTGFKLDEDRSRNVAGRGMRFVDHSYLGNASRFATARFYKRQMPVNRWNLVTDWYSRGVIRLDFQRESESCRIEISRGTMLKPTRVNALLVPWGPMPAESPAEPPEN